MRLNSRLLHVIGSVSAKHGGPTSALMEITKINRSLGQEVSIAAPLFGEREDNAIRHFQELGCKTYLYPHQRVKFASFNKKFTQDISRLIDATDIVSVHSFWNWPSCCAALIASLKKKKLVIRPAGSLDVFDVQKRRMAKRIIGKLFLKRLFCEPTVFHCTAAREATQLVTFGGTGKRIVLPIPVSPISVPSKAEARSYLDLEPECPVILFMSRLNYKKGIDILLDAFLLVLQKFPNAKLVIAGDGDQGIKNFITEFVANVSIQKSVTLLGFVEGEKRQIVLGASDLFVLPSMNENFGVSVVESLSCGVPVAISPEVYISDDIEYSKAVKVIARDPRSFAQGICDLLDAKLTDESIGKCARATWHSLYSHEVLEQKYCQFYMALFDSPNSV